MSKVNVIVYEGIGFNADWAATKTEKEFITHEKHHGLSDAQLKEAHSLCKTAVSAPKQAAAEQPTT